MCPDENALVAMIEHELDPARISELELHFGACDRCCRIVAALAGSRSLAHGTPRVLSPAAALGLAELALAIDDTPLLTGTIGGRYAVREPLGRGGMGTVYLARDVQLDREVALKLHRAGSGDERLEREAVAMAKLAHPNVVAVYEIGSVDDRLFVAMEYVRGGTLRSWLAARPRTWRETLALLVDVGGGLAAAHAAGLVHRDFKPENVLVGSDGRPRVSDFGLARMGASAPARTARASVPAIAIGSLDRPPRFAGRTSPLARIIVDGPPASDADLASARTVDARVQGAGAAGAAITVDGAVLGTPAYMAPEQFAGDAVDARCDQFAFCVVAWECLFGRRPFAGTTLTAIQLAIQQRELQLPARRELPDRVRRVLERGLAAAAADRYADMPALLAALRRAAAPRTRRRLAIAAASALIVTGAAIPLGSAVASYRHDRECTAEADAVRVTYGPETRKQLESGLAATGSPFARAAFERTSAVLERYTDALARQTDSLCREPEPDPKLAARRACLAQRTSELVGLIEALTRPDAKLVMRAPGAAWAIYQPTPCRDLDLRGPAIASPEHGRLVGLVEAGSYTEAAALGMQLADAAKRTGDRDHELAALLVVGRARVAQDSPAEAMPVLHRALAIAEALGRDRDAATALDYLAGITGLTQHDYTAAHRYSDLARAKLERLGDSNPIPSGRLHGTEAQILMDEFRLAEAAPKIRRAVELLEQGYGPDHLDVGSALGIESQILGGLGRTTEALAAARRAHAVLDAALGSHHPTVAGAQMTVAAVLIEAKSYDEARTLLQSADAVFARVFGPDHHVRAAVAGNLGELEQQLGRWDAATAALRDAVAILERTEGPDSPNTSGARRDLARTLAAAGRLDDALAEQTRAIAILEKLGADGESRLRGALVERAQLYLAQAKPADAVAHAERALAIAARLPDHATPDELAETRFTLARALWESSGDRRRARMLATEAAAIETGLRADITTWLAAR